MRTCVLGLVLLAMAGCVSRPLDPERVTAAERDGICPLHRERMTKERVRIVYGLTAGPPDEQLIVFPFAHRAVYGGCVFMTVVGDPELSSPEFADIHVCSACDKAKARWFRANPDNWWVKMRRAAEKPNKAPEPTTMAVTPRAPSSTSRASHGRGSS